MRVLGSNVLRQEEIWKLLLWCLANFFCLSMEQMYFITHLLFHWFLFVPWIAAAVIVVRAADMGLTRVILEATGDWRLEKNWAAQGYS